MGRFFSFSLFFSAGFQDARQPPHPLPPTWPGARSVTLTEGLEDARAGLVVVLRVRPVGGVLRRTLLPLLVARPPAVAPPTPVALGHVHTDVNGVVTCQRGQTERKRERRECHTHRTVQMTVRTSGLQEKLHRWMLQQLQRSSWENMQPSVKLLTETKKKGCPQRHRHPRVSSVHPVFAQYRQQPTCSFTCGCVLTSRRVCLPVTQKPAVCRLNSTDEAARLIFTISTT